MSGYLLKPASEEVTARIDWTQGYLEPGERIAADMGWCVEPGGEARIAFQNIDETASAARIQGGVPGHVYMVSARAQTDRGRALERALVMRIGA